MTRWWLAGLVLAGCGDNLAVAPVIDAPSPDAPDAPPDVVRKPDLIPFGPGMSGTEVIVNQTFTDGDCEMVEQCIDDVGTRRLLRFDAVTANVGTADLVLGAPPPDGVTEPPFLWSPCHGHHHYDGFAIYELLDGTDVVVAGHKQAFCVLDTLRVTPGAPTQGYDCSEQGLSVGWADVYGRGLPCQWIDVTDVAPGTYTLRVRINPDAVIDEADATNNAWTETVTL